MLGCLGDVIHDVVVRLHAPIRHAADTPSTITHRRGGSAANVAVEAARLTGRARFIGQVGADDTGRWLRQALDDAGVECVGVTGGRSGTVVSVVDTTAERSMLTDRGSADELAPMQEEWLDGLTGLHVPMYGFSGGALARTARELLATATSMGLTTSLDASSTTVIDALGAHNARATIRAVAPTALFVNEDEARSLDLLTPGELLGATVVVIKRGPRPAIVRTSAGDVEVAVPPAGPVLDTTGAGDAFAGGYLVALSRGADPVEAASAGHLSAASLIAATTDARHSAAGVSAPEA